MRAHAVTTIDAAGRSARPAGWILLVTAPDGVRVHAVPDQGEVVIGRDAGSDIVLDDAQISRRHIRIVIGDRCRVEDLGSRNGTSYRGTALSARVPTELIPGESVVVGPFSLMLLPRASGGAGASPTGAALQVDDPGAEPPPLVRAAARSPVALLIRGETGVGKEVLADAIHRASERPGPCVRLNCAAFNEALLETELFGHERGAFTGAVLAKAGLLESAAGGTVFLDEVGEMPPSLQAKLLRAIETREVYRVGGIRPVALDVRFIAATHRDLGAAVTAGGFRRDLFYRLAGLTLEIPPLRQRPARMAMLALTFADEIAARTGVPFRLAAATLARLERHDWPGNARELRNVIERAALLAAGGEVRPEHILIDAVAPLAEGTTPSTEPFLDGEARADRDRILAALEACQGNQTRAARELGVSRATLVHKLGLYRLPRPRKSR